jgi:hypothetical protein
MPKHEAHDEVCELCQVSRRQQQRQGKHGPYHLHDYQKEVMSSLPTLTIAYKREAAGRRHKNILRKRHQSRLDVRIRREMRHFFTRS